MFKVEAVGLQFLEQAFDTLSESMQKKSKQEIGDSATEAARIAKILVRVDTGFLQSQIFVRELLGFNKFELVAATPYAEYVEYGTSRMPAFPYIRPAIEQVGRELPRKILKEVMSDVRRVLPK
jgi:HK97 gp10 family phage protein